MSKKAKTAIVPTRSEDYPEWYQEVIKASDMAEHSPVRGCMVIKPWGYALWENIHRLIDDRFKSLGVTNAYFPIFIPLSFLESEAKHVEGFAKECAVVTHHRLEKGENDTLVPAGPLNEPLVVRPTSETIIMDSFRKWISSYRDLPLLINQWCNVVRWEMRTRLFLRTTEFLWQEGHTAHETKNEAMEFTKKILSLYQDVMENELAIPVIPGYKTESERFPGAEETMCIEAMMQDNKALQAGTSHFLGQNFSKASDIKFQNADETEQFVWTTSWGVSTRIIGALIMTHSDDNGLVLPPRVASSHIVLLPILKDPEKKDDVLTYTHNLADSLKKITFHGKPLRVDIDTRDTGGNRSWGWIKKGIPLRVEIGPRDMKSDSLFVGRRDKESKERFSIKREDFLNDVVEILDDMQRNLYEKALEYQQENTHTIDDSSDFYKLFTPRNAKKPEIHGGFVRSHWCGSAECESKIKEDLNVTIRCIPLESEAENGSCICCNQPSSQRVIFAKSY